MELKYHKGWITDTNHPYRADYNNKIQANRPFTREDLLNPFPGMKVLDVGAGAITALGNTLSDGAKIDMQACDPNAPYYNILLDAYGSFREVRTEFALGERLLDRFPANSFDLVYMQNALDHSINPILVLQNMLSVCKLNGVVGLGHMENEGEANDYEGLHQWNFTVVNNRPIIWNKDGEIFDLNNIFNGIAYFEARLVDTDFKQRKWCHAKAIKLKHHEPDRTASIWYDELLHKILYCSLFPEFCENILPNTGYDSILDIIRSRNPSIRSIL